MLLIRPFQNPDLPALARVWFLHWQAAGQRAAITPGMIDQAILSRVYFDPHGLLIAELEGQVVGFAHWLPPLGQHRAATLAAVCVLDHERRDEVADRLIQEAEQAAAAAGAPQLEVGPTPGDWSGYAGLSPIGTGEGVPDGDRASGWLERRGYQAARTLVRYRMSLARFRPPLDRNLLLLRRSAAIEQGTRTVDPQWRRAAALAHLDRLGFAAVDRAGRTLASAEVWISDPETGVVDSRQALLHAWDHAPNADSAAALAAVRYVLSAALERLATLQIVSLDATLDAASPEKGRLLSDLGFSAIQRGTAYVKTIREPPPSG